MQIAEISNKVNKLAGSWEEFKSVNDRRLKEIEKKGSSDPLLDAQVARINNAIDEQKSKLENIEVAMSRPTTSAGDISSDELAHKNAFTDYLRKGTEENLSSIESSSLSTVSDPEGGYLVRPQIASEMVKNISSLVPMRELASTQTISTDALDIIDDVQKLSSGWVGETDRRFDSKTPRFGKKRISVHEMYAQPKATQKLIDDSSINIEQWLNEKLTDSFAAIEGKAFIHGDGVGKPRGILSYEDGKEWGKIEQIKSAELSSDDFIKLYFALNEKYAANGTFLMNRYTLSQARMLKCPSTGQYIWTPGLEKGCPDRLLGAPVRSDVNMPVFSKGNLAVAFADFKAAYKIVDRVGVRVLRDPFTDKPFVKFYTTKRVGGDVVNSKAIKLLKHSG